MKKIFAIFAIAAMLFLTVGCKNNTPAPVEEEVIDATEVVVDSADVVIAPADTLVVE
jgi:PBP1b-binding outer membrane lipoprotein LpoB